jgi:hypothetical protein
MKVIITIMKLGMKPRLWIFIANCFICLLALNSFAKESAPQVDLTNWLTSPNGGESYTIGTTISIQMNASIYTPPGNPAIVVELYKGGVMVGGPSYAGMLNRTFSTSGLTPGADYKFRIYVWNDLSKEDWSNTYFSLTTGSPAPSLTSWLTSPDGGEIFAPGNAIPVSANSSLLTPPTLAVELYKGSTKVWGPDHAGMSGRTIPTSGLVAGSNYLVRIYNASNPGQEDWSNNYFSISGTPPLNLSNWLTAPNGGEIHNPGGSPLVVFENSAVYSPTSLGIELYKGSVKVWGPEIGSMGARPIFVSTSLASGSDYKVRIFNGDNPAEEDWSNGFFSIQPSGGGGACPTPTGYSATGCTPGAQVQLSARNTQTGGTEICGKTIFHKWYTSPTGPSTVTPVVESTGTCAVYATHVVVTTATSYWVSSIVDGCESTRTLVTASYPTLSAPTGLGAGRCAGGSVTLTATPGNVGKDIHWFTTQSSSGETPFATGASYTTATLSNTTTYYISTYDPLTGCDSPTPRVSVTATINPIPNDPNGTDNFTCGPGTVRLTATPGANGNQVNWYPATTGSTTIPPGNNYTTPFISFPAIYYITSYNTSTLCESRRISINATIKTPPPSPTVHGGVGCLPGATVQLSAMNTESQSYSICGKTLSHKWYTTETGTSYITPTVESTGTCAVYSTHVTVTSATSYWVSTVIGDCESPRTLVIASYQTLPPATGLGASICGSGSMTLTAAPGIAGKSIHWYNNQFNGSHSIETPFAEGTSYTTPSLDDSRTYYVSTYDPNTGCDSPTPRTPVTATVNPIPGVPRGDDNFTCGPGTVVLFGTAGTNGNMVRWYPNQTGPTTIPDGFSYRPYIEYPTKFYISSLNTNTGCESSRVSVEGTIKSPPPSPTGFDVVACHTGAQTSVQARNTESANYSICNKPLTHKWYTAETNGAIVPHTIHSTGTCAVYSTGVSITSAVSYWVVSVVDGCESARTNVTAIYDDGGDVPVLTVTPTLVYEQSKYFGAVFCALNGTASPTLTATGGTNASEFAWYEALEYGPAIRHGSSFTPSINVNETTNGIKTYYVGGTLRNGLGCPFTITPRRPVSVKLLEYQNNANAGPDKEFFTNYEPMAFTPNDDANFWRGNGTNYSPVNGSQAQKGYFYPSLAGVGVHTVSHTYKFSYTDTFQKCETQSDEAIYTVYQAPNIEFLGNQTISKGNGVTLAAEGDTYLSYQWYGPSGIVTGAIGNTFETTMPGVYSLEVKKGQIFTTVSRRVKSVLDNENYIITYTPQKSGYENDLTFPYTSVENVSEVVNYFDEIGRPMQNVITQGSPGNLDIVQPIVYDEHGREEFKYLPFAAGNSGTFKPTGEIIEENNQNYTGIAESFYKPASTNMIADDLKPYTKTVFEPSPLNRIIKQGAPGEVWQPNPNLADFSDKSIKKQYITNTTGEVLKWTYVPSTHLISAKDEGTFVYYDPNELYVTKTYDEHNKLIIEYTDKEGRVVLKRVQAGVDSAPVDDTNFASTYYIHDDLGNLVFVLPPEGVKQMLQN